MRTSLVASAATPITDFSVRARHTGALDADLATRAGNVIGFPTRDFSRCTLHARSTAACQSHLAPQMHASRPCDRHLGNQEAPSNSFDLR